MNIVHTRYWLESNYYNMIKKNINPINNRVSWFLIEDEKVRNIITTLGGNQEAWFLTEDEKLKCLISTPDF